MPSKQLILEYQEHYWKFVQVSIEISLYPLQKEFTPAIDRFIKVLQDYDDIEVRTNAMSTQLFGELDTLMDILKMEVKNVFNRELQSVFTLKIVNGDSRMYDKI